MIASASESCFCNNGGAESIKVTMWVLMAKRSSAVTSVSLRYHHSSVYNHISMPFSHPVPANKVFKDNRCSLTTKSVHIRLLYKLEKHDWIARRSVEFSKLSLSCFSWDVEERKKKPTYRWRQKKKKQRTKPCFWVAGSCVARRYTASCARFGSIDGRSRKPRFAPKKLPVIFRDLSFWLAEMNITFISKHVGIQ